MKYFYIAIVGTLLIGCGGGNGSDTAPLASSARSSMPIVKMSSSVVSSSASSLNNSSSPGASSTIGGSSSLQSSSSGGVVSGKTNILLIIADDLGLDASNQYSVSQQRPATPILDGLAAQGIIFDNLWATPACTTTRASLITGEHGVNSGISFVPAILDTQTITLQRYLRSQSVTAHYKTAVIGKWHLGGAAPENSHPIESGVEYYAGNIAGVLPDYFNWSLIKDGIDTTSTEYHTSKITDLAINWVAQQQQPWFLWLAYSAPHTPFHLPPENLLKRSELTGTVEDIAAHNRDYYLAAIEAMDTEIGRLLSSMSAEQRANTIILFIGDNGTPATVIDETVFSATHAKNSLYEGGIRVPMIVSGKGVSRTASREAALVNTTDFFATIASIAGISVAKINDSYNFSSLFSGAGNGPRSYNYSEFESANLQGWTVRNQQYKLIQLLNGSQELYDLTADIGERNDLLKSGGDYSQVVAVLKAQGDLIRNATTATVIDITDKTLVNRSANCGDYAARFSSDVKDVNNNTDFKGDLHISREGDKCIFTTNEIPNHNFNDAAQKFANNVSAQNRVFEVSTMPAFASAATEISLLVDNAILLNGVKVDLLAAGCFNVGDGKVGCNNMAQPWRYDPMFAGNGFVVDSHNAHAQPDGAYHYHGAPNAFYPAEVGEDESPVVGFAADGYPIFGPYINKGGQLRKALSSYRLKSGARPTGNGNPGGVYNGQYRDDYEYVAGLGDLDECNGMMHNGVYGYYITSTFPYILKCFKGTPDSSFNK